MRVGDRGCGRFRLRVIESIRRWRGGRVEQRHRRGDIALSRSTSDQCGRDDDDNDNGHDNGHDDTTAPTTTEAVTTTTDPLGPAGEVYLALKSEYDTAFTELSAKYGDDRYTILWEVYPAFCAELSASDSRYAAGIAAYPWPEAALPRANELVLGLTVLAAAHDECAHTAGTWTRSSRSLIGPTTRGTSSSPPRDAFASRSDFHCERVEQLVELICSRFPDSCR